MNACLVILLLVFQFTCHGKEQDGFPSSGILPTTKWLNQVETSQEASCPVATDIEPCECTDIDPTGYHPDLVMDCSNVEDEEQLRKVFSAFFPTTEFYEFKMLFNTGVKVLENDVFGNVSFLILNVFESVLEAVEIDTLTPSLSRLAYIMIQFCRLEIFPFEILTEFTLLQELDLRGNKIYTLPSVSSSSLRLVDLSSNLIQHLTPDGFKLLPAVEVIFLHDNQLTEIPKGTFTGLPELEVLYLYGNNISYLQSLTFQLGFSLSYNPGLDLHDNNIEYVEVDTFKDVPGPATFSMANNVLTRLPEEVWRSVLEKDIYVNLAGNDLACGCDVAWLVGDFTLLTMATDARCVDGTLLTDLNPADFDYCG